MRFDFENRTQLDDVRLENLLLDAVQGWPLGCVSVRVRPSRGAAFSGSCLYRRERIYVNLGSHVRYPYKLNTYLARAITERKTWRKPLYFLLLPDAYQLVLFVFLHEWYHLLVKRARRNTRQKESMCDRFAARYFVDRLGHEVFDRNGRAVLRDEWDFQDLNGFVRRARLHRPGPIINTMKTATAGADVGRGAKNGQKPVQPRMKQLVLFQS